jgi:hypothetical protein
MGLYTLHYQADDYKSRCDYNVSSSNNTNPKFVHHVTKPTSTPITLDSPLLNSPQQFKNHTDELLISGETSQILDDMRFIISSILDLPDIRSPYYTQSHAKLRAASDWSLSRISALPESILKFRGQATKNDCIYSSIRFAALIYLKAISKRVPLAQACQGPEMRLLFSAMWKVTLTEWRHIPGIFIWILLATIEAARYAPQGRLLKSMLKTASFHLAACGENGWEIVDAMLNRFANLQKWLRREEALLMKQYSESEYY